MLSRPDRQPKGQDTILVKKSLSSFHSQLQSGAALNSTNMFILRNKGSRNSSHFDSRLDSRGGGSRAFSESTQQTESFQGKYLRYVEYEGSDSGKILMKDFNFLDSLTGFEKVETLGKGAYAKVYHIRHKKTKQNYALKIYPKSYLTKPHRLTNIRSEVFLLSNLAHQNIVSLLNVYESDENVNIFLTRSTS